MNILYSVNSNYIPIFEISLYSLLENNKYIVDDINLYIIIENGISRINSLSHIKEEFSKLKKIEYIRSNEFSEYVDNISFNKYNWPALVCYRLFIDQVLSNDINKIIYIDCDTLILKQIQSLWNIDIKNYCIGGVQECMDDSLKKDIGLNENDIYINSGLLLMNLKKMRENETAKKFKDFFSNTSNIVRYPDQDAINVVLHGKILILPLKYNIITITLFFKYNSLLFYRNSKIYYSKIEYDSAKKIPTIIHFTSGFTYARPWFKNSRHPYKSIFQNYSKKVLGYNLYMGYENRSVKQIIISFIYDILNEDLKIFFIRMMRKINLKRWGKEY